MILYETALTNTIKIIYETALPERIPDSIIESKKMLHETGLKEFKKIIY